MPFAYIHFLDRPDLDRPVDPGWGVEGGGRPDQGLPGRPGRPGQGLPGRPGFGGERPGHLPSFGGRPGRPVDPGFGVDEETGWPPFVPEEETGEGEAGQLPTLPPGAVWPPLPPEYPGGKALLLVWVPGVGYRYAAVDIPQRPERPERPGRPERPEGGPERPGQGLPGRPTKPTPDIHHR